MIRVPLSTRWRMSAAVPVAAAACSAALAFRRTLSDAARRIQVAWLTYQINSIDDWLDECRPDGVDQSLALDDVALQRAALAAQRAALLPPTEPIEGRINRVPRREQVDFAPVIGLALIFAPWIAGVALWAALA